MSPRRARWYAGLRPTTPPPTITTFDVGVTRFFHLLVEPETQQADAAVGFVPVPEPDEKLIARQQHRRRLPKVNRVQASCVATVLFGCLADRLAASHAKSIGVGSITARRTGASVV